MPTTLKIPLEDWQIPLCSHVGKQKTNKIMKQYNKNKKKNKDQTRGRHGTGYFTHIMPLRPLNNLCRRHYYVHLTNETNAQRG